jgi:hypothetical protein
MLALFLCFQQPMQALGGHPLITEDTGTQGTGNSQLELTYELGHDQDAITKTRGHSLGIVLAYGLTENTDVIFALPYERPTEWVDTASTTIQGISDMEIAAKWRFYEADALSFALRPGLGLPTGNENKGLGTGYITPSLFAVMAYETGPWASYLHFGYTRNFHDGGVERNHIFHTSAGFLYTVNERMQLVGDVSYETNPEWSGHPYVGSMVIGLVYSVLPNLDVDIGYRKGLTESALDFALLTGLALQF